MIQPYLLPVVGIASPLCSYEKCHRKGRAVLGPPQLRPSGCVNRSIRCLTCGCTGVQSDNLRVKGKL